MNLESHGTNKKFILVRQDISKSFDWKTIKETAPVIKKLSPVDIVIHLAARAGVRASIKDPLLYEQVNYAGTLRLLELMHEIGAKHIIFGSSSSVYGNLNSVPFSETDEAWPISPYGVTKRAGELLCYSYTKLYAITAVCLRFFTVYGPRNRPDMAAFQFMKSIDEGKTIALYGDQTSRDFTYVGDIVDGIMKAVAYATKTKPGSFEVINLGNSSPVTVKEFIETLEQIIGKRAKTIRKPLPAGDMPRTSANISKAYQLLHWKPKVTLQQGLTKLWKWYSSQPS